MPETQITNGNGNSSYSPAGGSGAGFGILGFLSSIGTSLINNFAAYKAQEHQNWYNSPSEQMQRYKEAGINPYSALSNVTPGNQAAPTRQSINDPMAAIAGAIGISKQIQENALLSEQARGMRLDNDMKEQSFQERLAKYSIQNGYLQELSNLMSGKSTYQQFLNNIASLNVEYQRWFNSDSLPSGFLGADLQGMSPHQALTALGLLGREQSNLNAGQTFFNLQELNKLYQLQQKTEQVKASKFLQDISESRSRIGVNLRQGRVLDVQRELKLQEKMMKDFYFAWEQRHNMPWNSDPLYHIGDSFFAPILKQFGPQVGQFIQLLFSVFRMFKGGSSGAPGYGPAWTTSPTW